MDGYYRDPGGDRRRRSATAGSTPATWPRIDEAGYVLIKDRSKDIIISAGENISSVEIEVALARPPGRPRVRRRGRAGRQAWRGPGRDRRPQAGRRRHGATSCARSAASAWPRYKVPREIHFRDALPKGGTGKILKAELREPFWKGFESRVH